MSLFANNIRSQLKKTFFSQNKFSQKVDSEINQEPQIVDSELNQEPSSAGLKNKHFELFQTIQPQIKSFEQIYTIGNKIGEGAHAIVKLCHKKNTQSSYAVKVFRTGDPEIISTIKQTFHINRLLADSQYIIQSYELFIDERKKVSHWVMEYCDYPTFETIQVKNVQSAFYKLAEALVFMHAKGVSHRDLKPDNILVSQSNQGECDLKIIDFGVSKLFHQKSKQHVKITDMWTRTGTILYSAPEIFEGGGYNEKVDIWSVGVMLFQLLVGRLPYHEETNMDTIEAICSENESFNHIKEFVSLAPLAQDLLKRLLRKNPNKRLSAKELLLHPWVMKSSVTLSYSEQDILKSQDEVVIGECNEEMNFAQSTFLNLKKTSSLWPTQQETTSDIIKEWMENNSLGDHIHHLKDTEKEIQLFNFQNKRQHRKSIAKLIVDEQTHQRSSSFSLAK